MRVARLAIALLLGSPLLAACGSGGSGPDAGADSGVAPEPYFSLQKGRCFEYTTADTVQPSPDLGVVVEEDANSQFAAPTHVVAYYTNNGLAMRDYLAFEGSALVLYKREIGSKSYIYDPPLRRLQAPLKPNTTQQASAPVTIRDLTTVLADKEPHDLKVDVYPKDIALPVGKTLSGLKLVFTETVTATGAAGARPEYRILFPGDGTRDRADGFVYINFNFEADESATLLEYKLQKVRDLGDNPKLATPRCGGTP